MLRELTGEQLRRICDPSTIPVETTDGVRPLEGIVGQPRAVEALQFGLNIPDHGFNIYVAGPPGTGKTTAVKAFMEQLARTKDTPPDWCYVNNFRDPSQPRALQLPAGRGRELEADMKRLIERAKREIPKAFESEQYAGRQEKLTNTLNRQREELFTRLERKAQEAEFLLQSTPIGILFIPLHRGQPLSDQEFLALPDGTREALRQKRETLEADLKAVLKEIRRVEHEAQQTLQQMNRDVALYAVGGLIEDLLEKYEGLFEVVAYLKEVEEDIVRNLDQFLPQPQQQPVSLLVPWLAEMAFRKYAVNVIVDHAERTGAPVVLELNPTYPNLVGRIEKEAQFGALHTDFTLIRGGALHRANGGYLALQVEDVLRHPFVWDGLKRALRERQIIIEDLGERLGLLSTKGLQPEPIPLEAKLVLVGNPLFYVLLYALDPDFRELFKVKADFDTRMDWNDSHIGEYLQFLCTVCQKEQLMHLDRGAIGKIVEHSARLAEHQGKLSTRFAELADIIREANYWARQDGTSHITAQHIRRAIEQKVYRSNLIQEHIQELIAEGTLLVDATGTAVGQVNGLSVIALGDYTFGRPSRITASVRPGQEGVVDIEREAKLGGPVHTKGVLILSGYLGERYAGDAPLSLAARLVFEQSYEEVEGDSASSAELYALLSALSGLPLRQGIAVTGSVNQHGEVQAIGGVNQKIEGFFDVCKAKGLTGDQGVLIPASNVKNLMLREDVVEAVQAGQFHIYPVQTVDEGMELLTGVSAGIRQEDGAFPGGTVNALVEDRLQAFAEGLKEYFKGEERR